MPSTLGRNLHMCFTKIKRPSNPPSMNPDDHSHPFPSTTTTSSILIKNFNSLYDYNNSTTFDSTSKSLTLTHSSSSTLSYEPDSDSEPDFATVVASQRFFFTSPGSSNSIIESSPSIATTLESSDTPVSMISPGVNQSLNNLSDQSLLKSWKSPSVKDSVAVPTYSPDPYLDFRQSMQEMVEARDLVDVKSNWDYLHELLLCYLALNPKTTHKFIIGAFADLLISLMSTSETEGGGHRR